MLPHRPRRISTSRTALGPIPDRHPKLRKWFMAIALICEAKKGISALQLSRHLGVQHKTAWYLNHRIREAMQDKDAKPLGSEGQVVEIDEVYIGGKKRGKGVKTAKDAKIRVLGNGRTQRTNPAEGCPKRQDRNLAALLSQANVSPNAKSRNR